MSKLSIGIVGLPNIGKSTLFKALTKIEVNIANYPFCTIDPNVGVVPVPDERLDKLAGLKDFKKKIPAVVEFYDIAGLVKGAYKGEGLGNQFLSHIRETSAIVEVVRCFPANDIIHVETTIDPLRDIETINAELALKDLESIEKIWKKTEGEARTGSKDAQRDLEALQQARAVLQKNDPLYKKAYSNVLKNIRIRELNLLTAKPRIYFLNGKPEDITENLVFRIKDLGANYIIGDLNKPVDLNGLIKKSYEILNLITFFTMVSEEEIRAWTIERGIKAPQAAGTIHTDFEKKFVKAEVINWQKLLDLGGWSQARQRGQLRLEGREYVVQDGDAIEFKHG